MCVTASAVDGGSGDTDQGSARFAAHDDGLP